MRTYGIIVVVSTIYYIMLLGGSSEEIQGSQKIYFFHAYGSLVFHVILHRPDNASGGLGDELEQNTED